MNYQKESGGRVRATTSFGGLDRSQALCGGKGSFNLKNLYLNEDGALERRPGMRPLIVLPSAIRGATCIARNSIYESYAVAGDTVYSLSEGAMGEWTATAIGNIGTTEGEVEFICYDGRLLMLDGEELYTLWPDSVSVTQGYIPLYGKDWTSLASESNQVYEEPNLLSKQVRIRYKITTTDTESLSVRLFQPAAIVRILLNGAPYTGSAVYVVNSKAISLGKRIYKGDVIEVFLELPQGQFGDRSMLTAARRMADIGRAEDARIMFYSSPDSGSVWVSRSADHAEREHVRACVPETCMLYVGQKDRIRIGDGIHAVTGACRHYDRSLIFTTSGTWMVKDDESGKLELTPVNTTMGCSVPGAVAPVGNSPMTVFRNHVLCWNSETDQRDECNASRISRPVEAVSGTFFGDHTRLFVDTRRGEVWFIPYGTTEGIPIYQTETGNWTVYDGIIADKGLMLEGKAAVIRGETIYRMDESAGEDCLVTQEHPEGEAIPIAVEYAGTFLDFGRSGNYKRVLRAVVTADCGTQEIELIFERVDGRCHVFPLHGDGSVPSLMTRRAGIGRFRMIRPGFRATGIGRLKVYGLSLETRSEA